MEILKEKMYKFKKSINFAKNITMKTKIIVLFSLSLLLFTSCKKENSIDDLKVVETKKADSNSFKVTLDFVAQKDDDFALYYSVDGTINFIGTSPVWQGFKGSNNQQQLTFIVPDEIIPTQIRLDFGMKQDQQDIVLKSLKLEYNGKVFLVEGSNIFKYLMADPNQCTADINTATIKALVKDGKRLTPSLYPAGDFLGKEIQNITK